MEFDFEAVLKLLFAGMVVSIAVAFMAAVLGLGVGAAIGLAFHAAQAIGGMK